MMPEWNFGDAVDHLPKSPAEFESMIEDYQRSYAALYPGTEFKREVIDNSGMQVEHLRILTPDGQGTFSEAEFPVILRTSAGPKSTASLVMARRRLYAEWQERWRRQREDELLRQKTAGRVAVTTVETPTDPDTPMTMRQEIAALKRELAELKAGAQNA